MSINKTRRFTHVIFTSHVFICRKVHASDLALAINKMKLWKMFKGSTTKVIRQLIVKYQKDFEICGYEETLEGLRKIAKLLE